MVQLKKNIFYNALLTTSSLILPLITFPYVARILAPEGIGQINFANSFIQYFVIISSLGIPFYGIREIAKHKNDIELRSKILFELFIIKLICTIFAIIIYLLLIFTIPKFNDNLPYYLLGLGTIIIGIFDLNYFFSALEDFKYITIRTIFFQILSVIAIFVFIKSKETVLIYFIIPILINLFNTIVNINYILRFIDFNAIKTELHLRYHLKPLLFMFSIMFFTSIYNLLDTTILGFLAKNIHVGYYSVALRINRIPLALIAVLVPVMLPRISLEFKNGNYIEIKRLISKTIQFVILLGVPIMVGLYVTAPEIISLFSGKEFAPSIITIRIMSPIPLIIGITMNFSTQLLIPMGKEKQLLFAVIVGTFSSLLLNFILTPILQHNGAAISNLVTEIIVLITCYFFVIKHIKVIIPYKQIIINIILCIPFGVFVYISRYFLSSPILILFFSVSVSILYYLIIQIIMFKNSIIIEFKEIVQKKLISIFKS